MSTNSYTAGTLVRETGSFFDVNGVPSDPTAITLQYQAGASGPVTKVTYAASQVVRDDTGVYHYDIDTTSWAGPGTALYTVQWTGAGAVQARSVDYFEVTVPPITPL